MEKTRIVVQKTVKGRVDYNDGEFAEVQTVGIEGIEEDLWLETIQVHREDTEDLPEEFQRRFPVGMWLDISTTTDITAETAKGGLQNERDREHRKRQDSIQ
jgi:hypothetical protein